MLVSIYNVSPKSWPTFRDLCPRNAWLRSVCSLWPTLRRPLRCNNHSCDISSFDGNAAVEWPSANNYAMQNDKHRRSYIIGTLPVTDDANSRLVQDSRRQRSVRRRHEIFTRVASSTHRPADERDRAWTTVKLSGTLPAAAVACRPLITGHQSCTKHSARRWEIVDCRRGAEWHAGAGAGTDSSIGSTVRPTSDWDFPWQQSARRAWLMSRLVVETVVVAHASASLRRW